MMQTTIRQLGLILYQSPAFQRKLATALELTERALKRRKRPYVSFTSGKDSTAVLALVHAIRPEVTIYWSDDELEYPETVDLMAKAQEIAGSQMIISSGWATHANWFRPWRERPFWRDPLPNTIPADCDSADLMAARGYGLTFLGTRADESQKRGEWLRAAGPIYQSRSGLRCCPIWDWSADDVFALAAGWGLPINPVYDRLEEIGISRERQRVGPLPLTPRDILADGWPDLLEQLETRYGPRWHEGRTSQEMIV